MAARVLELRLGDRLAPGRARTLARIDAAGPDIPWLIGRSARGLRGANETLGREAAMLRAAAWRRASEVRKAHRRRRTRREASPAAAAVPRPKPDRRSLEPLLVDYFSRDGSTLLMRLLSSSPQVAVEPVYPFERKYFSYLWRWSQVIERGTWPEDEWGPGALGSLDAMRDAELVGPAPWLPRPFLDPDGVEDPGMARRSFELVWEEFSGRAELSTQRRHRSTEPVLYSAEKHMNTWLVPLEQLPPVELLVVLRDPRDTYVSITEFGGRGSGAFGGGQEAGAEAMLEHVISRQRDRLRWIAGLLEEGQVPVIGYERLVRDLDGVADELGDHLGVSFDPAAVRADSLTRDRHGSAASPEASIGRWRTELDPEVAAVFSDRLGAELRAVGLDP